MIAITANTWHYNLTSEERKLILGALLHDIGKVCVGFSTQMDHAKWGRELLEKEIKENALPASVKRNILTIVVDHHIKTSNEMVNIVKQADRISAGTERVRLTEEEDEERFGKRNITPLLSILSTVCMQREEIREKLEEEDSSLSFFPLVTLDDLLAKMNLRNFTIFTPSGKRNAVANSRLIMSGRQSEVLTEVYREIKYEFMNAINGLDYEHPFFLDALDAVLMRYLIFVPSAVYKDIPDISLYHHLKMTAAISLILYRTRNTPYRNKIATIEGDISGIQDFIFYTYRGEGSERGTAKRLRGRSFYISILTDAVVRYILHRLKLTPFHVVSKAGGHFMIFAPCSDDLEEKIKEIQHNINNFLHARYGSILKVVVGVATEDLNEKSGWFTSLLDKVKVDIERKKLQLEIFTEMYDDISVREEEVCRVCGLRRARPREGDDEFLKCEECFKLEEVGRKVVNANFIKITVNSHRRGDALLSFQFEDDFCISYEFLPSVKESDASDGFILALRPPKEGKPHPPFGYHLTGNYTPLVEEEDKDRKRMLTFEELTMLDTSSRENAYLAILKADVDDLGFIFTIGLKNRVSPSRLATLSFQLDIFFTRVVDLLAKEHNCYVVFSGGDDLTVMGRVDNLISFAHDLRYAFSLWSKNEKVTLSGGIYFNSHKFPAYRMIQHAGEALEKSKYYPEKNSEKNAITIFDKKLPWPLFKKALELYQILKQHISKEEKDNHEHAYLSRSVLYRLLTVEEQVLSPSPEMSSTILLHRNVVINPNVYFYYIISRNWKRKRSEEDREKLKRFLDIISRASGSYEEGGYLSTALKIFLLLSRFDLDLKFRIKT